MKKKILCLLCAMAMAAAMCSGAQAADTEQAGADDALTPAEYVEQKLYEAAEAGEESIELTSDELGDEWQNVDLLIGSAMDKLHHSCPEISWELDTEWNYMITDRTCTVEIPYLADADVLRQMQAEIEAQSEAVMQLVNAEDDLWDKLLVLHDYLCTHIEYAGGDYDQSIYGALVDGRCVCAGYANALAYFLDQMDLENSVLIGTAVNSAGEQETHAWNRITVNDTDYYMDLTWDDTDEYFGEEELVLYGYFMVSADALTEHYPDDPEDMPAAGTGEGELNYYVHEGSYLDTYSREAVKTVIAEQLDEGKAVITFRLSSREDYMLSDEELNTEGQLGSILSELGCAGSFTWIAPAVQNAEIYTWTVLFE